MSREGLLKQIQTVLQNQSTPLRSIVTETKQRQATIARQPEIVAHNTLVQRLFTELPHSKYIKYYSATGMIVPKSPGVSLPEAFLSTIQDEDCKNRVVLTSTDSATLDLLSQLILNEVPGLEIECVQSEPNPSTGKLKEQLAASRRRDTTLKHEAPFVYDNEPQEQRVHGLADSDAARDVYGVKVTGKSANRKDRNTKRF